MYYYARNHKFWFMYIFIIAIMSPIIMAGLQLGKFAWYDLMSIGVTFMAVPFAIATYFYEIFVFDLIDKTEIFGEANDTKLISFTMLGIFVFMYLLNFSLLFISEKFTGIFMLYFFPIIPVIQQRIVVTKDKVYCRLFHISREEIQDVIFIDENRYRIIMIDGKQANFYMKNAEKVFQELKSKSHNS